MVDNREESTVVEPTPHAWTPWSKLTESFRTRIGSELFFVYWLDPEDSNDQEVGFARFENGVWCFYNGTPHTDHAGNVNQVRSLPEEPGQEQEGWHDISQKPFVEQEYYDEGCGLLATLLVYSQDPTLFANAPAGSFQGKMALVQYSNRRGWSWLDNKPAPEIATTATHWRYMPEEPEDVLQRMKEVRARREEQRKQLK